MTVMPEHAVRLLNTTCLVMLDPVLGPRSVNVSELTLGDEILVMVEGRMCFRTLISADEAAAPPTIMRIAASALAPGIPSRPITLDSNQHIGEPSARSPLRSVAAVATAMAPESGSWIQILVENAARIVAENLAIQTGPLAPSTPSQPPSTPRAEAVQTSPTLSDVPKTIGKTTSALRAFAGTLELPASVPAAPTARMELQFTLPPSTTTLRLISAHGQPKGDSRTLGVAIFRFSLEGTDLALESPSLVRGFHKSETGEGLTWRWTNGEALLILPPKPVPQVLSVHITDWHQQLLLD